jgi:hypothetical protein
MENLDLNPIHNLMTDQINKLEKLIWKKYEVYLAEIAPKQKFVRVIKRTFESKNPKFTKRNLKNEIIKIVPISIDIPIEDFVVNKSHFDSSAFQSDDRFFTTSITSKRYSPSICKQLCDEALNGYNTTPCAVGF